MRKGSKTMMYVAHPTRFWHAGKSDRVAEFARKKGFAPVNPFLCGDFKDFEGGLVGREDTLEWTLHLQRGCHWSGYFGISDGVMLELADRLKWDKEKRMRVFYEDDDGVPFDTEWEIQYEILKSKYGDLLAELRGPNRMIALVGPSAVGKTYWIERLLQLHDSRLQRVKNTTTRPPRDNRDGQYYNLVSEEQFLKSAGNFEFLEHDRYLNHHYGSSLSEIKKVLQSANGIFAITPKGAAELYKCRFEVNVSIIVLKPASELVLAKNFDRRGEKDLDKRAESMDKAKDFILSPHIEHHVLELTGTKADEEKVFGLLSSLLK